MYQAIEVLGPIEHQMRTANADRKAAQAAALSEMLGAKAAKRRGHARTPLFVRWPVTA